MVHEDFDAALDNLSESHADWRDAPRTVESLPDLTAKREQLEDSRDAMAEERRTHEAEHGRIRRRLRNDNGISPDGAPVQRPAAGFALGLALLVGLLAFGWAVWAYSAGPDYELKIDQDSVVESVAGCVWMIRGVVEGAGRDPIELVSLTTSIGGTESNELIALPVPPLRRGDRVDFRGALPLTPTNCRRSVDEIIHGPLDYEYLVDSERITRQLDF